MVLREICAQAQVVTLLPIAVSANSTLCRLSQLRNLCLVLFSGIGRNDWIVSVRSGTSTKINICVGFEEFLFQASNRAKSQHLTL
jgi:hypothetical protein